MSPSRLSSSFQPARVGSTRLLKIVAIASVLSISLSAQAVRAGFAGGSLLPEDDDYKGPVSIGFPVNFFGNSFSELFISTNGYITFGQGQTTYSPEGLKGNLSKIIAPFFGDVDTRGTGTITHGVSTVSGRLAFGVNWTNVGYYSSGSDKTNNFQLVLIDRSDTGAGNFDIEFNYNNINWEAGNVDDGVNGLCSVPICGPAVGYSNGLAGSPNVSFELAGSHVQGAFLDSNNSSGLRYQQIGNSGVAGRLIFPVRNGVVTPSTTCPASTATAGVPYSSQLTGSGGNGAFTWTLLQGSLAPLTLSASGSISGTPTVAGTLNFTLRIADTSAAFATQACTITVIINPGGCSYTLGPGSGTSVPAAGGTGSVTVTTSAGCAWSATSGSPSWLSITSGFNGTGSGVVQYSALANSGTQRAGVITIAGQTYTVTQPSAGVSSTPDNVLTLAQFVGGGPEWSTTMFVTNLSNAAENYTIRFYDDAGLPKAMPMEGLGTLDTIAATLAPGQTRRYQTGPLPTLQVAWALLTPATPAAARLSGLAVFKQTVPGSQPGSTVSSEAVVDFTGVTSSKYVLLYDNLAGFATTAMFANPDVLSPLTILIDIRDEQGTILATDSITLPPLGHTAFVLTDRFPTTANRRGSIRLVATPKGFTGLGLRFSPFQTFTSFRLLTSNDIQ